MDQFRAFLRFYVRSFKAHTDTRDPDCFPFLFVARGAQYKQMQLMRVIVCVSICTCPECMCTYVCAGAVSAAFMSCEDSKIGARCS